MGFQPPSPDLLHLEKGDMLREVYSDGFCVIGTVEAISDAGAAIRAGSSIQNHSHSELLEKIRNGTWQFVRPVEEHGLTHYLPVKTWREEQNEWLAERAREEAAFELQQQLQDPALRTQYELEQKLRELEQEKAQTQQAYREWMQQAKDNLSFSKYAYGYWLAAKGELRSISEIPDLAVRDATSDAAWKEKLDSLDTKISDVFSYLTQHQDHSEMAKAASDINRPAILDEHVLIPQARSPEEALTFQLEAIQKYRYEGDSDSALAVAAGAVTGYRWLAEKELGSVDRNADRPECVP